MSGWVKNHRAIEEWRYYRAPYHAHLWQHLIRKAQFKMRYNINGQKIERGQVDFSHRQLAAETGISHHSVKTILKNLENNGEICTVHKGTNKRNLSIISISKYEDFQSLDDDKEQQPLSSRSVAAQQPPNFKKEKKEKKEKNILNHFQSIGLSDELKEWVSKISPKATELMVQEYNSDFLLKEIKRAWLWDQERPKQKVRIGTFLSNWFDNSHNPDKLKRGNGPRLPAEVLKAFQGEG